MKKIILILILLAAVGFFVLNYRSTPQNIDLAMVNDKTDEITVDQLDEISYKDFDSSNYDYELTDFSFKFTGYGPAGQQHVGEIESIIETPSRIDFNMNTVNTKSEKLNEHLCEDDFFDCENYSNSFFVLTNINPISEKTARVNGLYEMKGIEKEISFVADITDGRINLSPDNLSTSYLGRFLLDTTEFGFKVPIVDPNVLIEFEFSVDAIEKTIPDEELATSTAEISEEI